jgi:uncharacterized protein YfaS (alpha-2-macroglobulin family)
MQRVAIWAWVAVLTLLAACGRSDSARPPDPAQQQAWATVITGHTSGVVSRRSEVRVLFATDVAADNAAALLAIDPAVRGTVRLAGPRELVFDPEAELEAGQTYRVQLRPAALRGVPDGLPPFEFRFAVQRPQFEVTLRGLESDPADAGRMRLRGVLHSADVETDAKIEQLVSASYRGKPAALRWSHDASTLAHEFVVAGLERQAEATAVLVRWDGKPIGSGATGEQSVDVPARNTFLVTDAQAVDSDGRRQILVSFSDPLAPEQDLRGLVRLSNDVGFSTSVDGNLLTIYPDGELEGELQLTLEPGLRTQAGAQLGDRVTRALTFRSTKPQVRFVGQGVILPEAERLTIPFEAVSARSVRVTAVRIYEDNVAQFLQVNALDGDAEIGRVGRFLWRKTIALGGPQTGRWQRYELDVTELTKKFPGGMFQLTLQITPRDSLYRCDAAPTDLTAATDSVPASQEDGDSVQASYWDDAEQWLSGESYDWRRRNDPCAIAYYRYGENVTANRNLLASNVGLLAKRDQRGKLLVAVSNLRTGAALAGAKLSVRNFQNQEVGVGSSDSTGLATINPTGKPFLLVAEANGQRGYLKLASGVALPVSHFDVGGEVVNRGLKGHIYGDRDIWRPGDTLHLIFVLQDKERTLPANHPATLELYDPRGRLAQSLANTTPVGGFYRFDLRTAEDAPSGEWTAKLQIGDTLFSRKLRIETVMPNRLKIELDLGPQGLAAGRTVAGKVAAQWLSGGSAAGLRSDVRLRLVPALTSFTSHADYAFDDPAREFQAEPQTVFEGELDAAGKAQFSQRLTLDTPPPGRLDATFTTRVFERGGAFSINVQNAPYSPFERYVGVRLPKGDAARDMLLTDTEHVVHIASLAADGKPVAMGKVQVTLYKVEWRWWWDKSGDSLAQYVQGESNAVIRSETVATTGGRGAFKFNIRYPEWGRYLVRACDLDGGHCSGRTFYVDWPSWAGKQREQAGAAASVLTLTADREAYAVGDTATIQLPESAQGRALVTVENGTSILESRWLEPRPGNTRFTLPITAAMTPNVYVAVTLVQPHENRGNDRPLRLYGVIPLKVTDPATRLAPQLKAADEWKPASRAQIEVSEANGRAMNYTVAIVDEGLLGLTNFRTPDLHGEFYRREALGVQSWDLYDQVAGAYSAQLERLLALGGSDAAAAAKQEATKSRFPPVVRFLGPFRLEAGKRASHAVDLPQYVGAVRVMVVAGDAGAYGSTEKSVFVRQPLMLLPTMPRVIGPGEEIGVPVSLFVTRAGVRDVTLTIQPDSMFEVVGASSVRVAFERPEEKLGLLRLRTRNRLGKGEIRFVATSGPHRAEGAITIDVRSSNPPTSRYQTRVLQPGETWRTTLAAHGIPGTNAATLEVSGLPPLNLESRLRYLIQYPHGCLEQTISAAFPQLRLATLLRLEAARQREVEDNIRAGIERLRLFQRANGSFAYWPGGSGGFDNAAGDDYSRWSTTYASHFLIEAERTGYTLPPSMRAGFVRSLRSTASAWSASSDGRAAAQLDQAYRLYVLALAGAADVGAMNRLRETATLGDAERWLLAAAYQVAGLRDVATALTRNAALRLRSYDGGDLTFGSALRDRALLLLSLVTLGRLERTPELVQAISADLASEQWLSTQSVSFALLAMAQFAGTGEPGPFTFERRIGGEAAQAVTAGAVLHQETLRGITAAETPVQLRNTSKRVLFATLANRGVPAAGADDAVSAGLELSIRYVDDAGAPVDIARLVQGTDVVAQIAVRNLTPLRIDNIALTQMVPAGWEIANERLENAAPESERQPVEGERRAPWAAPATQAPDFVDIRDDRVLQYFGLKSGETIRFRTRLTASYLGRYYLPSVSVEAMYDASRNARSRGQWVQVVERP